MLTVWPKIKLVRKSCNPAVVKKKAKGFLGEFARLDKQG